MPSSKYYQLYKEQNPELHNKEKQRVNNILKSKYANDPEFREKCLKYQREYQQKKRDLKKLNNEF